MSDPLLQDSEYFDWQGIIVYQGNTVHKVGTDAVLLGSWVPGIIPKASLILDAGTGSGVLALRMARCYAKACVVAIDIDQEAIVLARLNVQKASLDERIVVLQEDVLSMPSDAHRFDLVVCNPPYHQEQVLPNDVHKQRAKHISTTVAKWMKGLCSRMHIDGHLMIVVPSDAAKTWIRAANDLGYHNQDRLDVFSFDADPGPKRALLHFTDKLEKPNISRLVIYQEDNQHTPEYLLMTGIRPK